MTDVSDRREARVRDGVPDTSGLLSACMLTLTAIDGDRARLVAKTGRSTAHLRLGDCTSLAGTPIEAAAGEGRPIVCRSTRARDFQGNDELAAAGVGSYVVLPVFEDGRVVAALNLGFAAEDVPTGGVVESLSSLIAGVTSILLNLVSLRQQVDAARRLDHDLRTPLAVVAGFAEQLQRRWTQLSEAEKLEGVEAIRRNSVLLGQLVEQASTSARVEQRST